MIYSIFLSICRGLGPYSDFYGEKKLGQAFSKDLEENIGSVCILLLGLNS